MLHKLRRRIQDEKGFTLIELLVVILIIGILAAVAIPTFLNQRGKAYDSNAESMAKSAQIAEETYATSNNGVYTSSPTALEAIDGSLADTGAATLGTPVVTASNYTVSATALNTGDSFSIIQTLTGANAGQSSETCTVGTGGGEPGACTAGSW
jgi:type IV pilus assembly protein PilA